ncbi:unnamed protein product [Rotaria socialis]|uniref:G-protein coupled receptors family 1 profile domain-containing protein n=2 Tax=Rotaria socialis TaxID=392032 RepID=A0A820CH04_9BILA|nr:unnamed protein product [Rotaria socialis]CAF3365110.1 unnamed protein product [Rotaria socialis]CAF3646261.1 unnamed protein product [Rotaria socialis]CAF4150598.1 unnamed protein product [Rotaria socialis]CAF4223376.1 unnamed protein product [Rotaria socialis]
MIKMNNTINCHNKRRDIAMRISIDSSTKPIVLLYNRTLENGVHDSNSNMNIILFIVMICVSIPSVFINLFAIYRLQANTKLSVFAFRTILHVSLFTTCTCVPLFLIELYFNSYFPLPPSICKIWFIVDYASTICLGLLVCWASIQRHILIFGPIHIKKLQSTLKYKLIPSIFAVGLPLSWYSILALTCEFDKTLNEKFRCHPCFENEKFVFLIDTILSLILPLFVTILVTFGLLIRIIRLRLRIFRFPSKKWRRCKRLTRQMVLFSLIYLIGLVPYVLTRLNSLYNFWPSINLPWCIQIADTFTYVPCCFSSFLSIYAFPEIWTNQRNRRHKHHHHHLHKTKRRHETIPVSASTILTAIE